MPSTVHGLFAYLISLTCSRFMHDLSTFGFVFNSGTVELGISCDTIDYNFHAVYMVVFKMRSYSSRPHLVTKPLEARSCK